MTSIYDSTLGHGSNGSPQSSIEEQEYPYEQEEIEKNESQNDIVPTYAPSPKHEPGYNWGSVNPIKSQEEGQYLLDTGYPNGRQIFNITDDKKIVKFQPDGTPENGYHSYEVDKPSDIPAKVLKQMLDDGKITKAEYNKLRKGKKI